MAGLREGARRVPAAIADGFRDERGFTTVGTVIALLIALSLLFSAAQVQRLNSVSAHVQDVADAAALAAQNEVAEFMVVVRVCDALVLTMTVTGLVVTGLGVAAACAPPTAPASPALLRAGQQILKARDAFSDKASAGLSRLQELLPFFSAANAAAVAQANNGSDEGSSYLALALPAPAQAQDIGIGSADASRELADSAQSQAGEIQSAGARVEELSQNAASIKQRAFLHDCGNAPGYCMYERAGTLAGMTGADNPLYRSADNWSFAVALKRAQAYYPRRLAIEAPQDGSIEEQARSELRKRFYRYAADELARGYVVDTGDVFNANFPRLPRTTDEMRGTSLYTDAVYPITSGDSGPVMHAWEGCPEAAGSSSFGSIEQMEREGFATCPTCGFTAASLGRVASASTSIDNGFEYHYAAVADAAEEYERARAELSPLAQEVKDKAGGLMERCGELLGSLGDFRIDAAPPGCLGSIVLVMNRGEVPSSAGFESGFVSDAGSLGARVALSAATLVEDPADSQGNVVSSLLDGLGDGVAAGLGGIVLDVWSGLLSVYASGQEAVDRALSDAVGSLPFASASGLGSWASGFLQDALAGAGLQPAKLDALKPVLVNSAHVAQADDSTFSARLVSIKRTAIENPLSSADPFSAMADAAGSSLSQLISGASGGIHVATIELFEGGPSFSLDVALPPAVGERAGRFVDDALGGLRDLAATVTGVRTWE